MNEKKHGIGHNIRQAVLVTVVLLVLCGLVFPVLLSGLSAVIFPSQAKGSLVTADGIAVGAKNVGQDFTEDYFMWGRPSAYNYNTYYEEDTDGDGIGNVPDYYSTLHDRKKVEDSRSLSALLKKPNRFTFILLGIILTAVVLVVCLVLLLRKLVRKLRRRRKVLD